MTDPASDAVRLGFGGAAQMCEPLLRLPAAVAYVAGPDLVFEFANEGYHRAVGRRKLIGRRYADALPEAVGRPQFEILSRTLMTGESSRRSEEVWAHRDGAEPVYVDSVYQPVQDDTGNIAGVLIFGTDVSEHVWDCRRLEGLAERLARSEERYRNLFEKLPLGVVHYNADGSILEANPATQRILGVGPSEMMTWPLRASPGAIREDGSAARRDDFPAVTALRTGEVVPDVTVGLPHGQTGELRWLRLTAFPDVWDEQGRPKQAYTIFADITEQRRAEAELRDRNRLLGRLRDANVVGVAAGTEEGVQQANDAFLDIIGYSREDLAAGRITWAAITPADWAAVDADAIEQLRLTGACRPYEKEHLHRDGHRVPVLIGAALIDRDPLRWAKFVVDLSAHQRREQERADLIAREQAARKEADTARERLAFLLQAGGAVEPAGNQAALLEQINRLVDVAAAGGGDRITAGRNVPATRRAHQALRAINDELERRVAERTSDLVRAESDRRALETELQQAERLQTVGQLTSSIAHDFSNLLAVIVGYSEMAEDVTGNRDPELHRILEDIRCAAERAVRLSGDLLSFSRRVQAKTEAVDLSTLIRGISDLLIMSVSGHAEVIFELSPDLPPVRANRGQLEQVLLNLAVNARDAMPEGGTLTIRTSGRDFTPEQSRLHPGTRPGRYVELAVQDTGIGMSADVRERIFERFFTTKPAGTGTGLGLSTVHGIISGAGGTIEVDSLEGRGTTFRIYLPAAARSARAGVVC